MLTVRDLVRLLTLSAHSRSDQYMLTVRDSVRLLTLSAHSRSDQCMLKVRDLISVFTLNVLWLSSAVYLDKCVQKSYKNA